MPGQIHRPGEQDPIPAAPAASSWRSHPCLCPSVSHRAPRSCTFWDSGGAGAVGRCPCLPQPGCSRGRARSGGSVGSVLGSSRCRRGSRGTADSLECSSLRWPWLCVSVHPRPGSRWEQEGAAAPGMCVIQSNSTIAGPRKRQFPLFPAQQQLFQQPFFPNNRMV